MTTRVRYFQTKKNKLESYKVAERIQSFVRLNNTVEPYKIDDEKSDKEEINEEIKESIKAENGKLYKNINDEEDEIEDNYSDEVIDNFEQNIEEPEEIEQNIEEPEEIEQNSEEPEEIEQKIAGANSPRIETESIEKPKMAVRAHSEKAHSERDIDESEIGEEEGLNIAENVFRKIADAMKSKNTTVINHFKDYIASQVAEAEDGKEYEIVYIPPMDFLEGLGTLGIDLNDTEVKCLMVILMKPELENVILVQDLCIVMENFGIEEDIDGITDTQGNTDRRSGHSSPKKEISRAVDMQALNNKVSVKVSRL